MNTTKQTKKHWKEPYQAFCLVCCGGGKTIKKGNKTECEREATSHISAYGHNVVILDNQP